MAGPADYGKITGPLGGATFLNADDYNAGSIATERLAGTYDRAVQRAETTRNMGNTNTLNEQKIQENQGLLKDQEQVRRQRTIAGNLAAYRLGMGPGGSAQSGAQSQPVATQSQVRAIDNGIEGSQEPVAPQAAQAAMPVAPPTQTVEITGQRMSDAEKAAYDAANPPPQATQSQVREIDNAIDAQQQTPAPMPAVSAASSLPAPVAPGGATPAPAVKAPGSSSAFDPDTLRQEYLDAQKGPEQKDIDGLKQMVDRGEITPEEAGGMLNALKADRIKNVDARVAFEKKIQDIVTSDVDNGTKRVALRVAEQEFKANTAFSLLQTYNDLGPEAATLAAQNAGLNIDFNDPKQVNALMSEAAQSKKFGDLQENGRKQAEADRKALGVDKISDLPPWIRPVVSKDKDGNPVVNYVDSDGKRLTAAEVQQASNEFKKSGSNSTTVTVGGSDRSGVKLPEGAVPLAVKPDQQITAAENRDLGLNTRENLTQMQKLYNQIIAKSGFNPNDSKFETNFKNWWAANMKNDPLIAEFGTLRQRTINDILRTNKGPQTDTDAVREADAQLKLGLAPSAYASLSQRLIGYNERGIKRNEAIARGYTMSGDSLPEGENPNSGGGNEFSVYKRKKN